jgi:hypothetical protein
MHNKAPCKKRLVEASSSAKPQSAARSLAVGIIILRFLIYPKNIPAWVAEPRDPLMRVETKGPGNLTAVLDNFLYGFFCVIYHDGDHNTYFV